MTASIDYPPPPVIDFGRCLDPFAAEKNLHELLDDCDAGCANKSDILVCFARHSWKRSGDSHPGPSCYDFSSPHGLRLHFSIRQKRNRLTVNISSQPRK